MRGGSKKIAIPKRMATYIILIFTATSLYFPLHEALDLLLLLQYGFLPQVHPLDLDCQTIGLLQHLYLVLIWFHHS
ncbi:hypothetical protein D3C80_1619870 [compost metagenome]